MSEMKLVKITPKKAKQYRETGKNMRHLNERWVNRMAADILAGKWEVNGETIKFNGNGKLIDGQHRMAAVEKANKIITTWAVYGVTDKYVDGGNTRTPRSWLAYNGITNSGTVASGTAAILQYLNKADSSSTLGAIFKYRPIADTETKSKYFCSTAEILAFVDEHPEIERSAGSACRATVKKMIPPAIGTALHFLFAQKDEDMADLFFDALAGELEVATNDPIVLLRNRLVSMIGRGRKVEDRALIFGLGVKTWNYWCTNTKVSRLNFKLSGPKGEGVPTILSPTK